MERIFFRFSRVFGGKSGTGFSTLSNWNSRMSDAPAGIER